MKTAALPEAAKIVMGQSPPSSSYNTVGAGLPFFQGKADFGDLYPSVRMFCTEPSKIAEAGDILISVRAPVGPTNINSQKSCIGRGLAAIRAKKHADTRYLLYFLRFYEPQLAEQGKGSTFSAISRSDLEDIRLPLPPLPEQQRIAGMLSKADWLRRLRHTARELGDTYLQSVFLEMFGDPVSNPREWERTTVGEVVAFSQYGTSNKSNSEQKGYPILGMGNITYSGEIDLTSPSYVELPEEEFKTLQLEPGDIIFNRTNSTELVGKTAHWNYEFDAVLASYLVKLKLKNNVLPDYFATLLNTQCYKRLFQERCKKAVGQSNVSPTLLKEFPMLVPPLPLQQQFAHVVHKFEQLRVQQREAERQAEHLFQTLLHRAFQGEL
jgi:type I restriction enzyme S subunit